MPVGICLFPLKMTGRTEEQEVRTWTGTGMEPPGRAGRRHRWPGAPHQGTGTSASRTQEVA